MTKHALGIHYRCQLQTGVLGIQTVAQSRPHRRVLNRAVDRKLAGALPQPPLDDRAIAGHVADLAPGGGRGGGHRGEDAEFQMTGDMMPLVAGGIRGGVGAWCEGDPIRFTPAIKPYPH